MTTENQIYSRLNQTGGRTALIRGASAPPRPPETVTVAPGVAASLGPGGRQAPLYVTAEAPSGRTIRRYEGTDVRAAADCAEDLTAERDPEAVWLCQRAQIRSWWSEHVADLLERRLDAAARRVDARLVVWTTNEDVASEESAGRDGANEERANEGGAVGDRYDVVLDR